MSLSKSLKLSLLLVAGLLSQSAIAQDEVAEEQLDAVRNEYKTLSTVISECENKGDCNLFLNELVVNKSGGHWRGMGNYRKTFRFWYSDDPTNCDDCQGVLRFVQVTERRSTSHTKEEFLFKDGKLLFHFVKSEMEGKKESRRSYFEDERIFRLQLGEGEVYMYQEALDRLDEGLLKNAKKNQGVFLHSF